MDPVKNPFSPGAGSPPPELVGRSEVMEQCRVLLARIQQGRPEKSLLLTGLRGVGKTVLLGQMEHMAEEMGYQVVLLEAHEGKSLSSLLAPALRSIFLRLDRFEGAKVTVRRGLAILRSFIGTIKLTVDDVPIGIDIEPERGTADTGDIELDLPELLQALAEAAKAKQKAVAILIDEIQYLNENEFSALIMGMHRLQQRQLPLLLIGAGLPTLPRLAGNSKSYAERLFAFPQVGALERDEAFAAIREPVKAEGVEISQEALQEICNFAQGYPYFLQEWGYQAWNHAPHGPITIEHVHAATEKAETRLDENFFRVRFDRLTPSEKRFLQAMAHLPSFPCRIGDIAAALNVKVGSLSPRRASLIRKGMIYSPVYGDLDFTVPLFDQFMKRIMPEEELGIRKDEG